MRTVLSPLIRRVFRSQYTDLGVAEDLLRDSDLDWTVIRPPRLTADP